MKSCANCKFRLSYKAVYSPSCFSLRLYCRKLMQECGFTAVQDISEDKDYYCQVGFHGCCEHWKRK